MWNCLLRSLGNAPEGPQRVRKICTANSQDTATTLYMTQVDNGKFKKMIIGGPNKKSNVDRKNNNEPKNVVKKKENII